MRQKSIKCYAFVLPLGSNQFHFRALGWPREQIGDWFKLSIPFITFSAQPLGDTFRDGFLVREGEAMVSDF